MSLFLLIHILILGGQSMIIKKSHFKLNNPTLEENLLPYKKKFFFNLLSCIFCIMLSISVTLSITQKFHSFYRNAIFYQVSKVNKVLSKIRSFNFKFSLRFWPNNWIQIFLLPCLPMNTTLVIVSYFFHLIIQKLFIRFFPHCLLLTSDKSCKVYFRCHFQEVFPGMFPP